MLSGSSAPMAPARRPPDLDSTQRTETCAKVIHNRPRLLPRGEVTAFRMPLIVDQLGVGLFGPTPWGRTYFIREDTHDRGDGDAFRCKEGKLVLPIETRRRNSRVRQPIERDVVENVVPREALGLTVEDACDQLIAPDVVVEDPGREADGGIRNTVQRLRTVAHLERIAETVLVEERDPIERLPLVRREVGRRGSSGKGR